jgi:RND family efflux transporter MFP subunit
MYKLIVWGFVCTLFSPQLMAGELPFQTVQIQAREIPQQLILEATIEAIHHSTVSAETTGRITEINFDINDSVKEGQVLMRITSAEQQASLAGARANVREAEVRVNEAETEYKRVEGVFAKKLVAKSALDKAAADLKAARERLQAAQAALKSASEKLKYTSIKAPFSGVVVRRLVEVGEAVTPGKPVMEGLSLDDLRVVAYAPQSAMAVLRNKPKVSVLFPQQEHAPIEVSDTVEAPRANPASHSFMVRANLPKFTKGVYPGMLAKMAMTTGMVKSLLVPAAAVVHRSELTAVYVVQEQRVSLRQVRLGRMVNGDLEVLAGLSAGETVALDPVRAGIYLKEQQLQQEQEIDAPQSRIKGQSSSVAQLHDMNNRLTKHSSSQT